MVGDQYQYAIVTDPLQLSLYVLARDPGFFAAKFDAQVRAQLNAWGFNQTINEPVPMIQAGCVPVSRADTSMRRTMPSTPGAVETCRRSP